MLEQDFGGWMSVLPSLQGQLKAGKEDTAFINTDIFKILILILLQYVHRIF